MLAAVCYRPFQYARLTAELTSRQGRSSVQTEPRLSVYRPVPSKPLISGAGRLTADCDLPVQNGSGSPDGAYCAAVSPAADPSLLGRCSLLLAHARRMARHVRGTPR
jgi:hypothetical protein